MKKTIILLAALLMLAGAITVLAQTETTDVHPDITGLENAILRVSNNETALHLEQVLEMIKEKRFAQFQKLAALHNLTFEIEQNDIVVTGTGVTHLLGRFNWNYQYQYKINENTGEMTRVKKWYDFAFPELDQ